LQPNTCYNIEHATTHACQKMRELSSQSLQHVDVQCRHHTHSPCGGSDFLVPTGERTLARCSTSTRHNVQRSAVMVPLNGFPEGAQQRQMMRTSYENLSGDSLEARLRCVIQFPLILWRNAWRKLLEFLKMSWTSAWLKTLTCDSDINACFFCSV
jgi:hypothetical protein